MERGSSFGGGGESGENVNGNIFSIKLVPRRLSCPIFPPKGCSHAPCRHFGVPMCHVDVFHLGVNGNNGMGLIDENVQSLEV